MSNHFKFAIATGKRPLLQNDARSSHWSKRDAAANAWKTATHEALMEYRIKGRYPRVGFIFKPIYPTLVLPDTGAVYPTTKAIVDALVSAEIIPDDNAWHNAYERHDAPIVDRSKPPTIEVTVIPLGALPSHDCKCRASYDKAQLAKLRSAR